MKKTTLLTICLLSSQINLAIDLDNALNIASERNLTFSEMMFPEPDPYNSCCSTENNLPKAPEATLDSNSEPTTEDETKYHPLKALEITPDSGIEPATEDKEENALQEFPERGTLYISCFVQYTTPLVVILALFLLFKDSPLLLHTHNS